MNNPHDNGNHGPYPPPNSMMYPQQYVLCPMPYDQMPITCIAYPPNYTNQMPYSYMPVQMANFQSFYPPMPQMPQMGYMPEAPARFAPKEDSPTLVDSTTRNSNRNLEHPDHDKDSSDAGEIPAAGMIQVFDEILVPDNPKERWKREDDKRMFHYLRSHCIKHKRDLKTIYKELSCNTNNQLSFWSRVASKLNWKGPVSTLQQRFIKLFKNKSLSVREENLFFKLIDKKNKEGTVPWEAILYHFPGKSIDDLKRKKDEKDGKLPCHFVKDEDEDSSISGSSIQSKVFKIARVPSSKAKKERVLSKSTKISISVNNSKTGSEIKEECGNGKMATSMVDHNVIIL